MAQHTAKLRCSLSGSLRNAARQMKELASTIRTKEHWVEALNIQDPAGDADYYAFVLEEIADHAAGTTKGQHSIADFAEHYCLTPIKPCEIIKE